MKLTKDQEKAMKMLKSGKNVFLTGEAGTGKSTLINEFRKYLSESKIEYIACAPTGVAAVNINGATLHHTFHVPLGFISEDKVDERKKDNGVVRKAKVIIIDEISMCRSDLFDYVISCINQVCPGETWCNGKQIVVVGDFSQLPPVINSSERPFFKGKTGFAFEGRMWKKCHFRTAYLHKIIRQNDMDFITALNEARIGEGKCVGYFNTLVRPYDIKKGITLCTRNKDADEINLRRLASLEGKEKHYIAVFGRDARETDFNGVSDLVLKKGARVMALSNDIKGKYVNGSMGFVEKLGIEKVTVRWDKGGTSEITPFTWTKHGYKLQKVQKEVEVFNSKTGNVEKKMKEKESVEKVVVGTIRQIPLRLSYAITIHKSQGNTFSDVNVDLTGVFQEGQSYVALSRCSSPEGLHIKNRVWAKDFRANQKIIEFYNECEKEEERIEKDELEAEALREAKRMGLTEDSILFVDENIAETVRKKAESMNMTISDYLRTVVH